MNVVGVELDKEILDENDTSKIEGRESWSSRLDFFFAVSYYPFIF
jgi:hypothetical protein